MRKSRKRKGGLFSEDHVEHTDDSGKVVGKSVERKGSLFTEDHVEHIGASGKRVGKSIKRKSTFLGPDYVEHRDESGKIIGKSIKRKGGLFSKDYVEHIDASGKTVGKSIAREGVLFGSDYTEHQGDSFPRFEESESGGSYESGGETLVKLGLVLALCVVLLVIAVYALVVSLVAVLVTAAIASVYGFAARHWIARSLARHVEFDEADLAFLAQDRRATAELLPTIPHVFACVLPMILLAVLLAAAEADAFELVCMVIGLVVALHFSNLTARRVISRFVCHNLANIPQRNRSGDGREGVGSTDSDDPGSGFWLFQPGRFLDVPVWLIASAAVVITAWVSHTDPSPSSAKTPSPGTEGPRGERLPRETPKIASASSRDSAAENPTVEPARQPRPPVPLAESRSNLAAPGETAPIAGGTPSPESSVPLWLREHFRGRNLDWNWHEDDHIIRSDDARHVAFRRRSGDRNAPLGLLFVSRSPDRAEPRMIGEDSVRSQMARLLPKLSLDAYPLYFAGDSLVYWSNGTVSATNVTTQDDSRVLAEEAWNPAASPDRSQIAFVSDSGESRGTLWLVSADGILRRQLTNMQGYRPGGGIRWIDPWTIWFELTTSDERIETWMIELAKGIPHRLGEGRVTDKHD